MKHTPSTLVAIAISLTCILLSACNVCPVCGYDATADSLKGACDRPLSRLRERRSPRTEPAEMQDYGNFMYPIKELLAMRYDAQLFTVFTTNLEPKDIRQRYGDRIADRLNEMMTKVVYRNPTYRTDNMQMADNQG